MDSAPRAEDLHVWAELMYRRAVECIDAGRTGEAVHGAGQLVERISQDEPSFGSAEIGDAMTLLARAFEADGDPVAAERVARSLQSRCAADGDDVQSRLHARAGALVGRYLREQGQLDDAVTQLEGTLAQFSQSADPGVQAERARARGELSLTYLAQDALDAAVEVGYGLTGPRAGLPLSIGRSLATVCAELSARTQRAGRIVDSVLFSTLAMGLLEADGSIAARRERAALCLVAAQGLGLLNRPAELRELCENCFATYRDDPDPATVESAIVAACLSAQTALALGLVEEAGTLADTLPGLVPASTPNRPELDARIGLIRASVALETTGPAAAEPVYAELISRVRDSPGPGARLFLALALDLECATLFQLDRLEEAAAVGRALSRVIGDFPRHEDFPAVAECGNRTAIRLITRDRPADAAAVSRAVISRRDELLGTSDQLVCVHAYVILADALRLLPDPRGLETAWREILELGEPALAVLEALADHYREAAHLRIALVQTQLGRAAVLAGLGREPEARRLVQEVIAEFADDEDEQIRRLLHGLGSGEPEDS